MEGLSSSITIDIILFLIFPLLGGLGAVALRISPMIGYIVSGIVLGMIFEHSSFKLLPIFADIGLIFLLFTVGLEVNLDNLKRFGRLISSAGLLQLIITTAIFTVAFFIFGLSLFVSFLLAFAMSLSSTAIVSKFIQENGEEYSLQGGMTLGMLLVQDLAVIPFMIILAAQQGQHTIPSLLMTIGFSIGKAAAALGLMFLIAHYLAPRAFGWVAKYSRELLNLLTLASIFVAVMLFSYLGLSPAIAAFMSGVVISSTLQHYQIFSQMRPLRDVFTILFFVFLGATINIVSVLPILPVAIGIALMIFFTKSIVIFAVLTYYKFHSKTSWMVGVLLSQVGEFAFIILTTMQATELITAEIYTIFITSTLITIAFSPILMAKKLDLYKSAMKLIKKINPDLSKYLTYRQDRELTHIDVLDLKDHVIICGYGRVGSYIGRALTLAKIPFMAIEYNFHLVQEYKKKGVDIIYGDPTDLDILDFAECEHASALVSAVPDAQSQEMIILNAKTLNKNITIFTRINVDQDQKRMKDLGANIVIQPEFEAALSIIRRVFSGYGLPKSEVVGKIKRLKIEHGMA